MDTSRRNGLVAVAVVAVIAIVVGIGYAVQAGRDTTGEDAAAPGDVVELDDGHPVAAERGLR